jgi:small subunit ribosomal protein S6
MAPIYDLMLLLDSAAPSERRAEILSAVESQVTGDGEIVSRHDWGVRNLTYEIDHRTDADYHLLQFHGGPPLLESLRHTLRITDGVIRFRIIKLRPGTPPPPEVRPSAPPAPAEAPADEAPAVEVAEPAAPAAEAPAAAEAPPAEPAAADQPADEQQPAESAPAPSS